jgi:predicted DNA-binding protein (UPF0251 family)
VNVSGQPFGDPLIRVKEVQILYTNALAMRTVYLAVFAIDQNRRSAHVQVLKRTVGGAVNPARQCTANMADRMKASVGFGHDPGKVSVFGDGLPCNSHSTKREIGFYTQGGHRRSPFSKVGFSPPWIKDQPDDVHFLLAA